MDVLYRISFSHGNVNDRYTYGIKGLVYKVIPVLSFCLTVGAVVKLYHEPDAESRRVTGYYIDMLVPDSVEGHLPIAPIHAALYFNHIRQTHFPHKPVATI
jgi:hypothetical protein